MRIRRTHTIHLIALLATASVPVSGGDLLFLSSINPTYNSFSFRATDMGASIVDPANTKLTIDGQVVTLTASPKVVDATDFTYHPAIPFPPNSEHNYLIEVKDTQGNQVTSQGTFRTDNYNLDKLHGYYAQIRSGSSLTLDKGGHSGQTGDTALDFGDGSIVTAALIPDATFLNVPAAANAISVSVWIKKHDNVDSSAFWGESPSLTDYRGFQASIPDTSTPDEMIYWDVAGNTDGDTRLGAAITWFSGYTENFWTNVWHHWVFTCASSGADANKRIFIDGQLFAEGPSSTAVPTDFTKIWLGAAGGGQGGAIRNMHGVMDDFALFGSALTLAQAQQLYNGTLPSALPSTTKPLAYWDFNGVAVTPTAPTLAVTRAANGAITIGWPASTTGFRLYSAPSLTGAFTEVQGVTGNSYTINNPSGTMFFRMKQ